MTDDVITDEAKESASPEERRIQTVLTRVLWSLDTPEGSDTEARKAAYAEARPAYRREARRILRRLEKRGVTMVLSATATVEDEQEED